MPHVHFFAEITKAEERLVVGIASTAAVDGQPGIWNGQPYDGDVVDPEAIQAALDDYMQWANIREMHKNSAVGTAVRAEVIDGQLQLTARVVDESAWLKVKEKVYKGFSIGGRVLKAVLEKLPDGRVVRRILKLTMSEISLVDRPANPEARILLWKGDGLMPDDILDLLKAAADPQKIIALIQAARNQSELDGDLEGAALYTQAIALILQAAGDADAPEAEGGGDTAADAEPMAMDEEDQVASGITAAAQSTNLRKAGRKISGGNMAAMHKVLKSLIEMMASAGDELAVKLAAVYAPAPEEAKTAVASPSADEIGAALAKALEPQLSGLKKAMELIAKQPVPGGPVLRQTEKVIAGQSPTPSPTPAASEYEVLKGMLDTESNPLLRQALRERLAELETKRALFGQS